MLEYAQFFAYQHFSQCNVSLNNNIFIENFDKFINKIFDSIT